jgi:hypothetical protein
VIEAMSRAKHFHPGMLPDKFLSLLNGIRRVQTVSTVLYVAGPIF